MEKVYFLLRNNQELGPFTRRQLLKQSLQPKDLVWVEGESASWRHPFEIETLSTTISSARVKKTKTPAFAAQAILPPIGLLSNNQFLYSDPAHHDEMRSSFINLPGGGELEFIVHKRSRKTISWDGLIGVAFVTLLVAIAWYGRHHFFTEGTSLQVLPVKPVASFSEQAFKKTTASTTPTQYNFDTVSPTNIVAARRVDRKEPGLQSKADTKAPFTSERVSNVTLPADADSKSTTESAPIIVAEVTESINKTDIEVRQAKPELQTQSTAVASEAPSQKKGLGKTLKGIFKKKKKATEEAAISAEQ